MKGLSFFVKLLLILLHCKKSDFFFYGLVTLKYRPVNAKQYNPSVICLILWKQFFFSNSKNIVDIASKSKFDIDIFIVKDQNSYVVLIAMINISPRLSDASGVTLRGFLDPGAAIAAMTLIKWFGLCRLLSVSSGIGRKTDLLLGKVLLFEATHSLAKWRLFVHT